MKIKVNDDHLFEINDTRRKVICNDIPYDIFEEDIKRRLQWVIMHKYDNCFKRLKEEWEPKLLENGISSFPAHPDEFAELVFRQHNYKCRKTREDEGKAEKPPHKLPKE
jgi:hypothetical protein